MFYYWNMETIKKLKIMDKDEEILLLKARIEALEESYKEIIKMKDEEIDKLQNEVVNLSVK